MLLYQLYIAIGEPNRAIAMYKNADRLEEMMRLVEHFHSEQLDVSKIAVLIHRSSLAYRLNLGDS